MNLNIGRVGCAHSHTLKCFKQGENEVFCEIVVLHQNQ